MPTGMNLGTLHWLLFVQVGCATKYAVLYVLATQFVCGFVPSYFPNLSIKFSMLRISM